MSGPVIAANHAGKSSCDYRILGLWQGRTGWGIGSVLEKLGHSERSEELLPMLEYWDLKRARELQLLQYLRMAIHVATRPCQRLARVQHHFVFAVEPVLQFADEIDPHHRRPVQP